MTKPTVMRWDHKNAPQVTNSRDFEQIKLWYQTIFETGYLADDDTTLIPPLGWTVTFDDGLKYIYLTQDTNGNSLLVNKMYIELQYNEIVTNDYCGGRATVWENENGLKIDQYGGTTYLGYGLPTFFYNDRNSNRICPYVVIGTNRGVYFLVGSNRTLSAPEIPQFSLNDNYSYWHYFGDFVNDGVDYGRNNQTCSFGYWSENANTLYWIYNGIRNDSEWATTVKNSKMITNDDNNVYNGFHIARDENGTTRGYNFTACPFAFSSGNNYSGGTPIYDLPYPYVDGSLKILPYDLWIRNNLSAIVGNQINSVYIGKMPGLYFPMHYSPLNTPNNLVEFEGSGEYEGQQFIGLARRDADEFYINITEDWGI